jgi:CheY-like chemotaxis protein
MLKDEIPVLFADDNADDRFLMAEAWGESGCRHRLTIVEDGERAIDYLSGRGTYADRLLHPAPGLIILDVKMPRRTGLEVLKWIRDSPQWRLTPVVMLTSSAAPSDVRAAYEGCANAFLVKPGSVAELVELVRSVCGFWFRFAEFPPPD